MFYGKPLISDVKKAGLAVVKVIFKNAIIIVMNEVMITLRYVFAVAAQC